ncbi:MAG: hypothetical protein LBR73_08655 [Oscillospiraceae bacterium]|jgi:hypothetical protein|nr:hypothetical protein [Oscillospiraceae bacterium]
MRKSPRKTLAALGIAAAFVLCLFVPYGLIAVHRATEAAISQAAGEKANIVASAQIGSEALESVSVQTSPLSIASQTDYLESVAAAMALLASVIIGVTMYQYSKQQDTRALRCAARMVYADLQRLDNGINQIADGNAASVPEWTTPPEQFLLVKEYIGTKTQKHLEDSKAAAAELQGCNPQDEHTKEKARSAKDTLEIKSAMRTVMKLT